MKWIIPVLVLAGTAFAQAPDPERFYKLDFVVKEVEGGKIVNSRAFSTMALMLPGKIVPTTIRAGGRVPVPVSNQPETSFNYFDLGVNIDARDIREFQSEIRVDLAVDISTIAQQTAGAQPVVRQNKWSGPVLVTPRKPTVVFTSDDITSKRQLQLELTATPVK